jgi:RNA polymerase-binding transcription factor DksA
MPSAFGERTVMPSHVDLDRARERLLEERERLQRIADALSGEPGEEGGSERDDLSELSLADQHPADVASETFEQEKDLSILDNVEEQLHDVEDALRRLDEGTYGRCEICGKPIGVERLRALPGTRYCIEHARELERQHAT